MNKRISILATFFMLAGIKLAAQVYPVSTRTSVVPPYPYSLSGFVDDMANKVNLNIDVRDATLANYPVKLRMVLRSNAVTLSTSASYITGPIYLNGGEPIILNSSDLANYFRPENLDFSGYSKARYLRTGQLPDGVYQLSFQVIDFARNVNISSTFPAFIYIYVNDPPIPNLPLNKKKIDFSPIQNIGFNWTFRHSPFSRPGFNPVYTFELWEVYPDFLDPYQVVRSAQPVYTEELAGTSLNYSIMHPLLVSGRTYAWRVRATDPEGITAFKDDGYSEVYWFKYGVNCTPPTLEVESVGAGHVHVAWETGQLQNNFTLRYRPANQQEEKWYSTSTTFLNAKVEPLRSNTEYFIEVQGNCGQQPSGYSEPVTVTTKMDLDYQCGETAAIPEIDNQERLAQLIKGTHITAGDFDVEIYSAKGSNGTFNGKGFVLVPMFNFLKLEADLVNISVNTDYQLIGGQIKTVYNLDNSLAINIPGIFSSNNGPVEETNDFARIADVRINATDSITSVYVTGGQVRVTTADGLILTESVEEGKLVAVTAPSGAQYVVDGSTNTVYTQSNTSGSAPVKNTSNLAKEPATEAEYTVSFEADPQQLYGFDSPGDKRPEGNYNLLTIGGEPKRIPWKSVESGRFDKIRAKVEGTPADSVYYSRESANMVMVAPSTEGQTKQLMVSGQGNEDEDGLYAWYTRTSGDNGKQETAYHAGSVNLVSYEKQTIRLCLVGVNNSVVPNAGYVETYLNSIYKQAVVGWEVSQLTKKLSVELPHENQELIDNTDANSRMDYTDDMKLVIKAMKDNPAYDKNTIYLFMADDATDANIKGYMPLKGQFGFIFKFSQYPDSWSRTIAHEVAHGCFNLRHTFSDKNKFIQNEGTTTNLMDYSNPDAVDLFKYQWDYIHDPQSMIALFQDEEEGEYKDVSGQLLTIIYNEILVKNKLFHLADIWDNNSLEALLRRIKPHIEQTFFVKDDDGYKIDWDRYYMSIGINNKSEFTRKVFGALTEEQRLAYDLAQTLSFAWNDLFYSIKMSNSSQIKTFKSSLYTNRKKELTDNTYKYTWIDGRVHDYMDPRTYYTGGSYQGEQLSKDIKELILLMNPDWVTGLTQEKSLKRDQRYYTLKSMFSEYMYNTGVYEIPSISSSKADELAEQLRLSYYEEETTQYDVLWSLVTIEKDRAEQIRLALEQRLAEDAALKAFLEKQKGKAIRTMIVGGTGVVTGVVIIVFFPPSAPGVVAGISTAVTAADIGFSLGTFIEGASMYHAITNDNFDRNKDYNLFRGIAVEMFGDGGARFYDLASIGIGVASATGNVFNITKLTKISGKDIEIIIKGINAGAGTVSSATTSYQYILNYEGTEE